MRGSDINALGGIKGGMMRVAFTCAGAGAGTAGAGSGPGEINVLLGLISP